MKNSLIVFVMLMAWGGIAHAQYYDRSAGIRLGHTSAMTYKKFVNQSEAVEWMLSGRRNGMQVTMQYVFHKPLEIAFYQNFYATYGFGMHAGVEKYHRLRQVATSLEPRQATYEDKSYLAIGPDALLGVEYRWLSIPMTIGMDIKPYFNFVSMRYVQGHFWDFSLSLKYVF